MKPPVSALLDTCAYRLTDTMEAVVVEHTVQWGPNELTLPIVGSRRKPPLNPNECWKQGQIEAMPTIARLAHENLLGLFVYPELGFELFRGGSHAGFEIGNSIKDVQIGKLPAAIERSKCQGLDIQDYVQKDRLVEFVSLLLSLDHSAVKALSKSGLKFTDFELQNLRSLDRFREICANLPEKHYPDAFHLWTAEVNGLDFFLTADKKFIRALTESSRVELTTRPIAARDLLDEMGVTELDPMPVTHYDFNYLF